MAGFSSGGAQGQYQEQPELKDGAGSCCLAEMLVLGPSHRSWKHIVERLGSEASAFSLLPAFQAHPMLPINRTHQEHSDKVDWEIYLVHNLRTE